VIYLQVKDNTQPVDVCIHHESYTIYSCDVGRSVIEIFDMYGKLEHVIDDQTTVKFQPTAIAVAYDGTIIVTSHFNHRLHMYSPSTTQQTDGYHYDQYKLGSPGHEIHQFHFPADLAIDYQDGYIYVCDRGNNRIQVLRPEGVCERIIQLLSHDPDQPCMEINLFVLLVQVMRYVLLQNVQMGKKKDFFC
jgi:6-phosphogluconolactonase (cycloisomerase 2 family)